jgi:hypothetical protein
MRRTQEADRAEGEKKEEEKEEEGTPPSSHETVGCAACWLLLSFPANLS